MTLHPRRARLCQTWKPENQIDYHRRVLAWFAHYLKGEESPARITEGVTALRQSGS